MFTILVAEDEQHIREGIITSIPWEQLQIDKVLQAGNGEEALDIATQNGVDILLTDIRMPRLNGIELSQKIRKIYPDCIIIFMSAYSDKEYLISAIQLKCSNFVEKPLQVEQLNKALEEAVYTYQKIDNEKFSKLILQNNLKNSLPFIANEVAVQASNKNADWELLVKCANNEMLGIDLNAIYVTLLIKFIKTPVIDGTDRAGKMDRKKLAQSLADMIACSGLKCFYGTRDEEEYLFHISGTPYTPTGLNQKRIEQILKEWYAQIEYKRIIFSIGTIVQGFEHIPETYQCAKQALNKCFFRGYGSIVCFSPEITKATLSDKEFLGQFSEALENARHILLSNMVRDFCAELQRYENTDIEEIRGFFRGLVIKVLNRLQIFGFLNYSPPESNHSFIDLIQSGPTLMDLRNTLLELLDRYFVCIKEQSNSNSIPAIIGYIEKHYGDKSLDISQISQNTFLSPAYLCTYFKRETDKTINQYITEYRLNKSLEFLKDKNNNISDVASLVGYDDGNYFTRLFKNKFGMSPSKYRESLGMMI